MVRGQLSISDSALILVSMTGTQIQASPEKAAGSGRSSTLSGEGPLPRGKLYPTTHSAQCSSFTGNSGCSQVSALDCSLIPRRAVEVSLMTVHPVSAYSLPSPPQIKEYPWSSPKICFLLFPSLHQLLRRGRCETTFSVPSIWRL